MNRFILTCMLVLTAFFALLVFNEFAGAQQNEVPNVRFHWAFGALTGPADDKKPALITQDTTLKTGDRLKIFVRLETPCFIYLLHRAGQGEMNLLFPFGLDHFDADYVIGKNYYIPRGIASFELDGQPGTETFYLLASTTRLTVLETLLKSRESSGTDEKLSFSRQIVAEIRELRKQNKTFSSPAERPEQTGGIVRGLDCDGGSTFPDLGSLAVEVSAKNFYGKTYTIEHQ